MRPERIADIIFFIGFAGIMWGIFAGSWNPEEGRFVYTVASVIGGIVLVGISITVLIKSRAGRNDDEDQD